MAFHDAPTDVSDPGVVLKAKLRTFTAKCKLRILEEVGSCTAAGQVGALLRKTVPVAPDDLAARKAGQGNR